MVAMHAALGALELQYYGDDSQAGGRRFPHQGKKAILHLQAHWPDRRLRLRSFF